MRKKQKTVFLVTPRGVKQAFSIEHAERLLRMGPALNGGWQIDESSEYYFDKKNGIRRKANKRDSEKA